MCARARAFLTDFEYLLNLIDFTVFNCVTFLFFQSQTRPNNA